MDYLFPAALVIGCILLPTLGAACWGIPGIIGAWLFLRWLGHGL